MPLAGRYGYHRDELYFLAAGRHLDWGYVDQPPLTPLLTRGMSVLVGDSLVGSRILPALLAVATVLVAALISRELGGARAEQLLTAGATAISAMVLIGGHWLSTTTVDLLIWAVLCWLVIRAVRTGGGPSWLWAGLAAGIGLQNKTLVLFLLAALVAGLLARRSAQGLPRPLALGRAGTRPADLGPEPDLAGHSRVAPAGAVGGDRRRELGQQPTLVAVPAVPAGAGQPGAGAGLGGGSGGAAPLRRPPSLPVPGRRLPGAGRGVPVHRWEAVLHHRSLPRAAGRRCAADPAVGPGGSGPAATGAAGAGLPGVAAQSRADAAAAARASARPGGGGELRRRRDRRLATVRRDRRGRVRLAAGRRPARYRATETTARPAPSSATALVSPSTAATTPTGTGVRPRRRLAPPSSSGFSRDEVEPWCGDLVEVARIDNGVGLENDEQGAQVWTCRSLSQPWNEVWPQLRRLG